MQTDLIASQLGAITSIVTAGSQIYEGTTDPVGSGFLPENTSKPAYYNLYDLSENPIAVRWWNVATQTWK